MTTALQVAGATTGPSAYAPLHVNRMLTGLWTNSNPLRDAATSEWMEKFYGGRQDRLVAGINCEITPRQTLRRRPGSIIYNSQSFPPIKRFYAWALLDDSIKMLADTQSTVFDATGPNTKTAIWQKSPGAGSTYFLNVGDNLYFTNGVDNKQVSVANGVLGPVYDWGVDAPTTAPTVTQMPRPQPYPSWLANTAFGINVPPVTGMVILDDTSVINTGNFAVLPLPGNGHVAIGCGQNLPPGAAIPLPSGFDNTRIAAWTAAGTLFGPTEISGVYQSTGSGGFVNSSFQTRSGGNAESVPSNWIAIAWDTQAANDITASTSGGISTYIFKTTNGDDIAIVTGTAPDGTTIPIPPGFSLSQVLSICSFAGCDNTGNALNQVYECYLKAGVLTGRYMDGSGNAWTGLISIFAVFWKPAQGTSTQAVTNGTALVIPAQGSNTVTMVFSSTLLNGSSYGLPAGYPSANTYSTCSVTGGTPSGSNNCQGWACSSASQVLTTYYRDGSGNQWDAFATGFTVAFTNVGSSGNMQYFSGNGTTGANEPSSWNPNVGQITQDGSVQWVNLGPWQWQANHFYRLGDICVGAVPGMANQIFVATTPGISGALEPVWPGGPNLQQQDGGVVWTCAGHILGWSDIGPATNISAATSIIDSNGYQQTITREGKTGPTEPHWVEEKGATTTDNTLLWTNAGGYSVAGTASVYYGYAYEADSTSDISNMSPPSVPITVKQGNQITIQGVGAPAPVTTIPIYRTLQGGSTYGQIATIPNPGAGQTWTYIDTSSDADVNLELQAQIAGEGTPLPAGATCLAYHVGRIWAAVGNIVYASSGPDAVIAGSSGNAGFNLAFRCESRVVRFWVNSLGIAIFTVRDVYLITGNGTPGNPFVLTKWIETLPLLNYDAFDVHLTTPYLFTANKTVMALDPSAGLIEISFPIADLFSASFDPKQTSITYHNGVTGEAGWYVSDGTQRWFRLAPITAPDNGWNWNPPAYISGGMSAVQSCETSPGIDALLIGPPASGGPILQRSNTTNQDNNVAYPMEAVFGSIVLAQPGQMAGLSWITLEAENAGTAAGLSVLFNELTGNFEAVPRSRQDPPNLPPSQSLISNRHSLLQGQTPVWCRHMRMQLNWPSENQANELLAYTIFGQMWQEMRAGQ